MNNTAEYGFRPYSGGAFGGRATPNPIKGFCVTGQSFDVNGGAANVSLRKGDPVRRLSSGGFALCDGTEGAGGALAPWGIVAWVGPYWDGRVMKDALALPSDIAWGTNLTRMSTIGVIPIHACLWEIDADTTDATFDTEAEYLAFVGENVDHILTGASGASYAYPKADISTHNTTNTLLFEIVGISGSVRNQDFSGTGVKLVLSANIAQQDSTTGV